MSAAMNLATKAISGFNSGANAAKKLLDDSTAFSSCVAIFRVIAPFLACVSQTASTAATNLFLSEDGPTGVGLSHYANRFAPIGLGLAGVNSLAVAAKEAFSNESPVSDLVTGAFCGASSDVFGLKRAAELLGYSANSKSWSAAQGLSTAAAGILGVVFAAYSLDKAWSIDPKSYRPHINGKVWPMPEGALNKDEAHVRAVWMKRCKIFAASLLVTSAIVPHLRSAGGSLPIFRSMDSKVFLSLVAAARGALYLAASVLAMDLLKLNKDSDGDYVGKPETNVDHLQEGKLKHNEFRQAVGKESLDAENYFNRLANYGFMNWTFEAVNYVGEKANSFSWTSKVAKVAGAGLMVASRTAELAGRIPLAAWSMGTAGRLKEGRQITKLAALVATPQRLVKGIAGVSSYFSNTGLAGIKEQRMLAISLIATEIFGPLSDMMARGGSSLLFVTSKAGYPLTGRIQVLVASASKKWFIIPAALGLAGEVALEVRSQDSLFQRIYGDIQLWRSAKDGKEPEYQSSAKDRQRVVDLGIRTGMTALAAINWARGSETKNAALAFTLFEGALAALKLSDDWSAWMGERKRVLYETEALSVGAVAE